MPRDRALIPRALLPPLAALLALASCEPARESKRAAYRPLVAHNANAAASSRLPQLLERGPATGRGVLVAEWDEGAVRASHADLTGRVVRRDGGPLSEHATHIAGTMIGSGALDDAARGMAVESLLWSYRWDWDVLEERAAAPFIAVSAHAYGVALGWAPAGEGCESGATFFGGADREDHAFGAYGPSAAELDRMLYETGAISVWAAGNERMDAGPSGDAPHYHYPDCATEHRDTHADEASLVYGTLGGPISAKNAIAVGAVAEIAGDVAPELIVPLSFSSFGPTDDGRIKPDLAASGETLYSASAAADDAYGVFGGTSSAAAVVAGGIALLTERYRLATDGRDPSAAEIKALLVETAREAGEHDGPDYQRGYGLFDVAAAASVVDGATVQMRTGTLEDGELITLRTAHVEAGTALRVTLAWLDPPARADGSAERALVNDIDVELIAPDGETSFHPWRLDPGEPAAAARRDAPNAIDTVERVDIPESENLWSGEWAVRVQGARPLHRGAQQPFALVASAPIDPVPRPELGCTRHVLVQLAPGVTTAEVPLAIDNLGGDELAWWLASDTSWLELTELEGKGKSRPTLRVDASELAAGELHLATLELGSAEAGSTEIGVVVQRACEGECRPAPRACATVSLGSALGASLAHGQAAPASGVRPPSCGASNGANTVFTWRAPHADTFDVTLRGAASGAVLYALAAPCDGEELECDASDPRRLALELAAGEAVALVVDSPADDAFELSIQSARGACVGQCGGTPDQGGCYCDASCIERGDCCESACEACGHCDAARCEPQGCGEGERCVRGGCEPDPCWGRENGDRCDDRDACTDDDVCIGGACAGISIACAPAEGEPDASTAPDAGPPPIGETDAGRAPDAGEPVERAAAGCGCRVAVTERSPFVAPLASLALLLLLAHRASRRRSP